MTKYEILERFNGVKQNGENQWMGLCPAHNDHNPSLSFKWDNGKMILHCFAGCNIEHIIETVGLTSADLNEDSCVRTSYPSKKNQEREHIYKDSAGNILAKKVIYRKSSGKKDVAWYRYDKGNYIPKLLKKTLLPPYHIEKLKGGK